MSSDGKRPPTLRAADYVWSQTALTPSERLVLLALGHHVDERRQCFPGLTKLVGMTGLSRRSVQRVIDQLSADGHLRVDVGKGAPANGGWTSRYFLRFDSGGGDTTTPPSRNGGGDTATSPGGDMTTSPRPRVMTPATQGGVTMTPKPSSDHPTGGSPTGRPARRDVAGPSTLLRFARRVLDAEARNMAHSETNVVEGEALDREFETLAVVYQSYFPDQATFNAVMSVAWEEDDNGLMDVFDWATWLTDGRWLADIGICVERLDEAALAIIDLDARSNISDDGPRLCSQAADLFVSTFRRNVLAYNLLEGAEFDTFDDALEEGEEVTWSRRYLDRHAARLGCESVVAAVDDVLEGVMREGEAAELIVAFRARRSAEKVGRRTLVVAQEASTA